MRHARIILPIAGLVGLAGIVAGLWACDAHDAGGVDASAPDGQDAHASSIWPGDDAALSQLAPPPVRSPKIRVYLDAGHGAENNSGNRSAYCIDEQDFTLALARDTAAALESHGGFEVKLSRGSALKGYRDRVAEADAWPADVFVSLHSDVRGHGPIWEPEPGKECPLNRGAPGFTVLWSDEGDDQRDAQRLGLARAVATELSATGLPAYDGSSYATLYAADASTAGVFVDRHELGERIFVLRAPTMPSVLIETHNAIDDREARRWDEPATRRAFALALMRAIDAARL